MAQRQQIDGRVDRWAGRRLERVTTAWFEHHGDRRAEPMHLWVDFAGVGWRQLHGAASGQDVVVLIEDPYGSYEMPELEGRVVVEAGGPAPLANAVGQQLRALTRLRMTTPIVTVGLLLTFEDTRVGVINPADELLVATWPDADWVDRGIEVGV